MKTKSIFFCGIFLLSLLFVIACVDDEAPEAARQVKGIAAELREVSDETGGFGTLSFISKLDITASQDGMIKKMFYREGGSVRQGETVIFLENPHINLALERSENLFTQAKAASELARSRLLEGEFQAEAQILSIEKSEAELVSIKKKWDEDNRKHQNQEALFDAGGINQETILSGRFGLQSEWDQILIIEKDLEIRKIGCREQDLIAAGFSVPPDENGKKRALVSLMTATLRAELAASLARLEVAEKELQSARIIYEDMKIKSRAAGVVGGRYFEEGEWVKAGEKIVTLMDTSSLYAIFPVREKDALRIEKGMTARIHIDGINEERQGRVDLVYPQADSQSLSFLVRVLLEGGTEGLKPGMFSRVKVQLGSPNNCVFLPASALAGKKNNEAQVFVINGNRLSGRKVNLGQVLGDSWEITSGIKAGEVAVMRPDSDMQEGTLVSLAD